MSPRARRTAGRPLGVTLQTSNGAATIDSLLAIPAEQAELDQAIHQRLPLHARMLQYSVNRTQSAINDSTR